MSPRPTSHSLAGFVAVLAIVLFLPPSQADIPKVINYQGKVTDTGGTPVADGTYSMQFSIYDSVTAGNILWNSSVVSVAVSEGIFEVLLGESPQDSIDLAFDEDYWLEVDIDGDIQSPRAQIGSSAYSYMASGLVPGTVIAGDLYIDGDVGIGNTAPTSKLDVSGGSINTDTDYRIQEVPVLATSANALLVGQNAGANSSATSGTFVGYDTGPNNVGQFNTFVGGGTGNSNTDGSGNTFIGGACGRNNTTGYDNVFVGGRSGYGNTTGHSNTFVGRRAGYNSSTADSCIFIGSRAGFNENTSNRLYIEPTDADASQALIYGEFDNDILTFNARVGIGETAPECNLDVRGSSSIQIKEDSTGDWMAMRTDGGALDLEFEGSSLSIQSTTDNQHVLLNPDRNSFVGIRTSTPTAALDVNGRVEIANLEATEQQDTGALEIGNSLRLDGNEIITNVGVALHLQNGNNGDLRVDDNSLVVDANDDRVGIGTANPDAPLHLYATDDDAVIFEGDDHIRMFFDGPDSSEKWIVFRNVGSTSWVIGMDDAPSANAEDFVIKRGNDVTPDFVVDSSGEVGIGTSSPGYALQVGDNGDGTEARANAWNLLSSRKYKSNITALEENEYSELLRQLVETDVVRYRFYQDENETQHLGIIAEDAPQDIVTRDGEALSLSDYCAFLLAATKAQQEEIEVLKARISQLEGR